MDDLPGSTTAPVLETLGVSGWVSLHTDVDASRVHPDEAVAVHAEIPHLDQGRLGRRRSQRLLTAAVLTATGAPLRVGIRP